MDNKEQSPKDQLAAFIQHEVQHAVQDSIGSLANNPNIIRKLVGETYRHLGNTLSMVSTSYLPLEMSEFLVQPERMINTRNAIILTNRPIAGENTFTVLVNTKKVGEDLVMDITSFRINPDSLGQSTFFNFPEEVRQEIARQAKILITGEGNALFQGAMLNDFFAEAVTDVITEEAAQAVAELVKSA